MNTERIRFESISPTSWEHPSDAAAFSVLRQVPGIPDLIKAIGSFTSDRALRLLFLGSSLRVSSLQFPRVHQALVEACRILDVEEIPELYVAANPIANAAAIGFEKPFLVVHSELIKTLSYDELLYVIGHELAHVKAGHMVYRTVLWILTNLSLRLTQADDLVRVPIVLALRDWERKSELSCDRAGLLVCQDPLVATAAMLKIASGGLSEMVDPEELTKQAQEYEQSQDLLDSLYKFTNVMNSSHPLLATRYAELQKWAASSELKSIMEGNYVRLGQEAKPEEAAAKAWNAWKDELNESKDAGTQLVGKVVQEIEKTGKEIEKIFKSFFS